MNNTDIPENLNKYIPMPVLLTEDEEIVPINDPRVNVQLWEGLRTPKFTFNEGYKDLTVHQGIYNVVDKTYSLGIPMDIFEEAKFKVGDRVCITGGIRSIGHHVARIGIIEEVLYDKYTTYVVRAGEADYQHLFKRANITPEAGLIYWFRIKEPSYKIRGVDRPVHSVYIYEIEEEA